MQDNSVKSVMLSLLFAHVSLAVRPLYHLLYVQCIENVDMFSLAFGTPKPFLLLLFGICVVCQTANLNSVFGKPNLYRQCSFSD